VHLRSSPVLSGVCVVQSLVLCLLLFVSMSIFLWLLCCLYFCEKERLITPLITRNLSYLLAKFHICLNGIRFWELYDNLSCSCKIIHTLSCKQELYEHWWIVRTFWKYKSGNQKPKNQRRTDNPLAKNRLTNNDLQNTPQSTTDQQYEPH
jgi:hypothetical protein